VKKIRYRKKQEAVFILPVPLVPKAAISKPKKSDTGRSSDLLLFLRPSRHIPVFPVRQWQQVAKRLAELTASGNVRDLHPVPFSSPSLKGEPMRRQMYKEKTNGQKNDGQAARAVSRSPAFSPDSDMQYYFIPN
jgi:hypothetical protein